MKEVQNERTKNKNPWLNAFFKAALIIYLLYLSYLTFFSSFFGRTNPHRSISLIPFKTIIHYITIQISTRIVLVNIAGNIVSFMPMGFILPLAFDKLKRFPRVLVTVMASSAVIEIMQYVAGVGVSDIDDLILNTIGGILGYLIYKVFTGLFWDSPAHAKLSFTCRTVPENSTMKNCP